MNVQIGGAAEPHYWMLIFSPRTASRLAHILAFGHFKHVSALGYVAERQMWLTFDAGMNGTRISLVSNQQFESVVGPWIAGSTIVRMPRRDCRLSFPLAGWCVPAVKRLVGLDTSALRPDALYRYCLDHQGEVVYGEYVQTTGAATAAAGPLPCPAAEGR